MGINGILVSVIIGTINVLGTSRAEYASFHELEKALKSGATPMDSIPLTYRTDGQPAQPINVTIRVVVTDVKKGLREHDLDIIAHLQAMWIDKRLTFRSSRPVNHSLSVKLLDTVWTPDIYMEPEWDTAASDKKMIRIFTKGVIGESQRVKATVPCLVESIGLMDKYMKCTTKLVSYAYDEEMVHFIWDKGHPVMLEHSVTDSTSQVNYAEHGTCMWDRLNGLATSCLELRFRVTQRFESVMYRLYAPSFMAVMMAWSSFWIHRDEVSARIKLGTLVVWTVMTQYLSVEIAFPHYLDNVAGNVWLLGCMAFTWLSFFLYIVIHVVRRREKARIKNEMEKVIKKEQEEKKTGTRALSVTAHHPDAVVAHHAKGYSVWDSTAQTTGCSGEYVSSFRLERWCRIWFIVAFITFVVFFWTYFGRKV